MGRAQSAVKHCCTHFPNLGEPPPAVTLKTFKHDPSPCPISEHQLQLLQIWQQTTVSLEEANLSERLSNWDFLNCKVSNDPKQWHGGMPPCSHYPTPPMPRDPYMSGSIEVCHNYHLNAWFQENPPKAMFIIPQTPTTLRRPS